MKTIWKLTLGILGSLILVCAAPAQQNAGGGTPATSSVSNGQWVNAGEYIWTQITSIAAGTVSVSTNTRILQTNGVTTSNVNTIASCALSTSGGYGFGYQIPAAGWLQSTTTQVNTGGFPQGTFYIQHFIMTALPGGGTTNSCTNSFSTYTGVSPVLVSGGPVGSFYPVGFVGTSVVSFPPWAIPGYTTQALVSNPSAGADWKYTPPATGRTCIVGIFATYTASATVANRTPILQLGFNSGVTGVPQLDYITGTPITASQVVNISWSPGANAANFNTSGSNFTQVVPFNNGSPVCFNSGITNPFVGTSTTNIQTGDQWSNVGLIIQVQNDNN